MACEKAPPAPAPPASRQNGADGSKSAAAIGDIRRSRPYFLSPEPLAAAARRAASIAALIALDLVGVTLGVYGALALRDLVYGNGTPRGPIRPRLPAHGYTASVT
jgi:hypothetical protein